MSIWYIYDMICYVLYIPLYKNFRLFKTSHFWVLARWCLRTNHKSGTPQILHAVQRSHQNRNEIYPKDLGPPITDFTFQAYGGNVETPNLIECIAFNACHLMNKFRVSKICIVNELFKYHTACDVTHQQQLLIRKICKKNKKFRFWGRIKAISTKTFSLLEANKVEFQ